MNYNELMNKLDEYGGAMAFLSRYRKTLLSHRLTPELIADILERGADHEYIQPRSNAGIANNDN